MLILEEVGKFTGNLIDTTYKYLDHRISGLFKSLKTVKGNARVMILSTPFWAIPMTWLGVYQSVFVKSLGVTAAQIGFVTSLGMVIQIGTTILGGFAAEKWGRKRTLMFWDTSCFLLAFISLIFAVNIWYFILYTFFLNARFVGFPAWKCMCIEGVEPKERGTVYSLMNFFGAISSFFVIFAGFFIQLFGLDTGTRIIIGACIVGVSAGLYYRNSKLVDSKASLDLVKEAEKEEGVNLKKYYLDTVLKIYHNKNIFWLLITQVMVVFTFSMWNLYWPIYFTDENGLGLKLSEIPLFPLISSVVNITVTFLAISLLKKEMYRKVLLYISILPVFAALIYILTPPKTMYILAFSFVINNIFASLFGPIIESMTANSMSEKERVRLYSVFITLVYMFCVPSTAIAGLLYSVWPRLLFIVIACFTVASFFVIKYKLKYSFKSR